MAGEVRIEMRSNHKIIRSPLSQQDTSGGITISIEVYSLKGSNSWTLELVQEDGSSTVWEEQFPTDAAAFAEFTEGLSELGPRTA